MKSLTNDARVPGSSLYGLYVGAVAFCLAGNLLVRLGERGGWLGPAGRISFAVAAALPLLIAAIMFWRLMRQDLDEMLQRIVLEGFAFALVIYLPLAALFVNLRTAGAWMPRLDPADILMVPALLVGIGITLAWRRLQ